MRLNSHPSSHFLFELAAYRDYLLGDDNISRLEHMKKVINRAIYEELTPKQRTCIVEYYINRKPMKHIAESLNVHPSTVTRHIQTAKKKLRRIEIYC